MTYLQIGLAGSGLAGVAQCATAPAGPSRSQVVRAPRMPKQFLPRGPPTLHRSRLWHASGCHVPPCHASGCIMSTCHVPDTPRVRVPRAGRHADQGGAAAAGGAGLQRGLRGRLRGRVQPMLGEVLGASCMRFDSGCLAAGAQGRGRGELSCRSQVWMGL